MHRPGGQPIGAVGSAVDAAPLQAALAGLSPAQSQPCRTYPEAIHKVIHSLCVRIVMPPRGA